MVASTWLLGFLGLVPFVVAQSDDADLDSVLEDNDDLSVFHGLIKVWEDTHKRAFWVAQVYRVRVNGLMCSGDVLAQYRNTPTLYPHRLERTASL